MTVRSLACTSSLVILFSGALLAGCASTTDVARCDTSQVVGTCSVNVKREGSRLVVCPDANSVATPACMNATVNVKRAGAKAEPVTVLLHPGRCVPLDNEVVKAEPEACQAFATTTSKDEGAQLAKQAAK